MRLLCLNEHTRPITPAHYHNARVYIVSICHATLWCKGSDDVLGLLLNNIRVCVCVLWRGGEPLYRIICNACVLPTIIIIIIITRKRDA